MNASIMTHATEPPQDPTSFDLAAEGPTITEEHRLTGDLLERRWRELTPEQLAAIRELIGQTSITR